MLLRYAIFFAMPRAIYYAMPLADAILPLQNTPGIYRHRWYTYAAAIRHTLRLRLRLPPRLPCFDFHAIAAGYLLMLMLPLPCCYHC